MYRVKALEMIELIFERVIHPKFGTGVAQFSTDWTPQRAILFEDV